MPRRTKKEKGLGPKGEKSPELDALSEEQALAAKSNNLRAGKPDPRSVVGETAFTSPKGFKYRIIHTTEEDATDAGKVGRKRSDREE